MRVVRVDRLGGLIHEYAQVALDEFRHPQVYQPAERLVVVTADLVCQWLVSEGDPDLTYTGVLRGDLLLND